MSRDRSLDDFLSVEEGDEQERDGPADHSEPTPDDGATGPAVAAEESADDDPAAGLVVRPAESTMDWTPGGAACEACGTSVERRWRDGDRLVCAGCKEW